MTIKHNERDITRLSHFKSNWSQISNMPSYIVRTFNVLNAGISNRSVQTFSSESGNTKAHHVRALTSYSPIRFHSISREQAIAGEVAHLLERSADCLHKAGVVAALANQRMGVDDDRRSTPNEHELVDLAILLREELE